MQQIPTATINRDPAAAAAAEINSIRGTGG